MISQKQVLILLSLLLISTLACGVGGGSDLAPSEEVNVNSIATSVALTIEASGQNPPPNPELPTPLPEATSTPEASATPTFTPTVTLTPTPSIPIASVSQDTNCRTGPDKDYDYIGAMLIGEKAEVVGKNTSTNYWIIKNPDANGTCWLWGYYATISGNTDNLQEYAIPPTPTPEPPIAPSNLTWTKTCVDDGLPNYKLTVDLSWKDNSTNESKFLGYMDGVLIFEIPSGQTHTTFTTPAIGGTLIEFAISAINVTGESAKIATQVTCP